MIGVSPGTKNTGFAIIKDGTLEDWGVKEFKGKWSDEKLNRIIMVLEKIILRANCKVIAVKEHHPCRTSPAIDDIIHGICLIAFRHNLKLKVYTIEELKHICDGMTNKECLSQYVEAHYPEVSLLNRKLPKHLTYHFKLIEAIALAHIQK